ncbi:MAG: hypothetical protein P8K78_03610 [Pirellulales bacterium]|nr:hypothetical protein [Pirellulales bacterium]
MDFFYARYDRADGPKHSDRALSFQIASLMQTLIFVSLGLVTMSGWADETNAGPLKQIDRLFRGTYDQARTHVLEVSEPIIIARSEDLVLLRDGKTIHSVNPPGGYRALTTVSHITLTIFLLLEPYGEGEISEEKIERLRQLGDLALEAKASLAQRLDPSLAEGQIFLIDTSRAFIQKVVDHRRWTSQELAAFLQTVRPQILKNVQQAAKFRIDHFHRQMMDWKKIMTEEEWKRLRVVVSGAAMPRTNNLAVQYFSKLFGVRGEGLKITYAESVFSDRRTLQILGTNLLDAQIGAGYFSDPWRMHRDLMGNAAAVYLDGLILTDGNLKPDR